VYFSTLQIPVSEESRMRKAKVVEAWVVYKMSLNGKAPGPNAVCEQGEWEAMELAEPGRHALIRSGITNEAEAERVAREADGGTAPGKVSLRRRL